MNSYKVASTFEDRGIRPPPEDSVTVGEADLTFIHLRNGDDPGLLHYVRSGGIAFPHIMIPETLQLRGAATKTTATTTAADTDTDTDAVENGTVSTKPILRTNAEVGSVLETVFSHALWLWNAKQHTAELVQTMQTRTLRLAESWLPSPVAAVVFGDVAGTLAAANAERLQAEEANEEKAMLAKTEGPIACVAWHPHRSLVAIAHRATDTVFLYDLASNTWCPNVLQNVYMQSITSMAWQPNCGYTLAVGCTAGVCLWSIMPPASSSSRSAAAADGQKKAPSMGGGQFSAWMTLLSYPKLAANGVPAQLPLDKKVAFRRTSSSVSSLAFSPSGQWLVTGHQSHGHLTVWDVALGTATPLRRSGSSSRAATLRVGISPDGRHLVSVHANGHLRLWETETWGSRLWSDMQGIVTQFAWAPDSRSLFFAVARSPDIYALALHSAPPSAIDAEISIVTSFEPHATAVSSGTDDDAAGAERIRVGGAIKSLALDPTGQRLVVGFDDDSASSDISLLAVYLVNSDALFRAGGDSSALMPLGYIRGPDWGEQQRDQNKQSSGNGGGGTIPKNAKLAKKRVRLGPPIPSWFGFAPNFAHGALLTVAWANGKISFVPMLFRTSNNAASR
ncbi:hypothetical protein LPJ72_004959 [Coemansia sp. Benny D160-2]|nr:hypothetical protein LPJ72_004959 [Coemansia sp. Benny D160-2]